MKLFTVISMPKTIYFNFKMFPIKTALKLPVFVAYNTKFGELNRGAISFEGQLRRGMVKIGFTGLKSYVNNTKNYINIGSNAKIIFKDGADFAKGVSLTILGDLVVGSDFFANDNFRISCHEAVIFGDNVRVGWDVRLLDSDNHSIFDETGNKKTNKKPIKIGNHVWIGAMVQILKGSEIGDDSVVAYGSLVCKKIDDTNVIIGGYPAKVINRNITWQG